MSRILKAIRKSVTTTKSTYTVTSSMVDFVIFRNDGSNLIKINFEDDSDSNYWTLPPGEGSSVAIDFDINERINFLTDTSTSNLEMILWG